MKPIPLPNHRLVVKPADAIEELMMVHGDVTPPDDTYTDIVRAAIESLPDDMYDVYLAVFSERVPYSELGQRLGCSKTQAWRKAQAVIVALKEAIITDPLITERYVNGYTPHD